LWGDLGKKIYQSNVVSLKKKFGDYILISSNFPTYNSYLTKENYIKFFSRYSWFDLKKYLKNFELDKSNFHEYVSLIKFITQRLNKKVVIRPHPSESVQGWRNALKGVKNALVENEGELLPMILASEFIIQNNCTSAIEASTVNKPVINYSVKKKSLMHLSERKKYICNKLSINVFGKKQFEETMNNIELLWNKDENKKKRKKYLNNKLKGSGTIMAAKKIAQKIIDLAGTPNPRGYENLGKDSILYDIYEVYRNFKFKPKTTNVVMDMQKRETISYKKIQKDIANLLSVLKINKKVKLKRIERNTFYLFPLYGNNAK
jgi:hypothetical protein